MKYELSNPEQYSQRWEKESEFLEFHGVYEKLSEMTPVGNVLEFGCGIGNGTRYLSIGRNVLSLDSNSYLIDIANANLNSTGSSAKIHKCDFFELTENDKKIINDFNPKIIVGWFIGSHGIDIFKHTTEESNELAKSKLYRERIEDIIVSPDICLASVEYIHLVSRGGLVVGISEDKIFNDVKADYDTHVFGKIGFEVSDVKHLDWPREGSEFQYVQSYNPNLAEGKTVTIITSIIAQRVK